MYNFLYFKRVQMGLTQRALAEQSGVSRRTICSLESTGRIPSPRVGVRLCRVLGCGWEEVFPLDVLL